MDDNKQLASCEGKVSHASREAAQRILRKGMTGHPYKCPFCHAWHIGGGSGKSPKDLRGK